MENKIYGHSWFTLYIANETYLGFVLAAFKLASFTDEDS